MNKIQSFFEDVAIYVGGAIMVLMMCVLYCVCRICGVRMEDDF